MDADALLLGGSGITPKADGKNHSTQLKIPERLTSFSRAGIFSEFRETQYFYPVKPLFVSTRRNPKFIEYQSRKKLFSRMLEKLSNRRLQVFRHCLLPTLPKHITFNLQT
jgi:hypothetical protein